MTNKEFCRIVTEVEGEEVDSIKQIVLRSFNGEELKEWLETAIEVIRCSTQLNVSFNVGDKVVFDNKKAVVLWTSVNYLDIEIVGTNKILQGVHTSKVLPR